MRAEQKVVEAIGLRGDAPIHLEVPVTVMVSRVKRPAAMAYGTLREVSGKGAVFTLSRELQLGDRILLYLHCSHPTEGPVQIVLPSEVVNVTAGRNPEVQVYFRGRHRVLIERKAQG